MLLFIKLKKSSLSMGFPVAAIFFKFSSYKFVCKVQRQNSTKINYKMKQKNSSNSLTVRIGKNIPENFV